MTTAGPSLPAVVLLSGGLDSAATAAIAAAGGFAVHAVSFDYGQRHRFELEAAARVAAATGPTGAASHRVLRIDLRAIGGSALTDDIDVPKDQLDEAGGAAGAIPITYVPARNTIFLSYALACAEVIGSRDIFIGVNAIDYSGYPDCRPAFVAAFEAMANLATRHGVEPGRGQHPIAIHTPLIDLTKAQIIRKGMDLGVDFGLTHSCYDPGANGRPCGHCDSCLLRAAGFAEVGIADPALG